MDPDPRIHASDYSCYFRHWPSRPQLKTNLKKIFLLFITFWNTYSYIIFQRKKVIKKSQNRRNQCFSYYFCLMIEGSGSEVGSGSVSLTNGSGSGRPKNIWILRIRIRNIFCYQHRADLVDHYHRHHLFNWWITVVKKSKTCKLVASCMLVWKRYLPTSVADPWNFCTD